MNSEVFLVLKRETVSLLVLLCKLKKYYIKHCYQNAINNINEAIIASNNSLILIDKQLNELKYTF